MDLKNKLKQINGRKVCMVLGSILIFLPTSLAAFWGNISIYVASFFLAETGSMAMFQSTWVVSLCSIGVVFGLLVAGRLTCWDQKWNLLIEIILSNLAYLVSYLAATYHLAPLIYVSMFIAAICIGLIDVVVFQKISDFATTDKGLMVSIACSGISFGPFFGNPLTTIYVNPNNLRPDSVSDGIRIFTQMEITEKVPTMFLVLGIASLVCELIGFVLFIQLKAPEKTESDGNEGLISEQSVSYGTLGPESGCVAEIVSSDSEQKTQNAIHDSPALENGNTNEEAVTQNGTMSSIDAVEDKTPTQLLRSASFWVLCFCSACQMFSNLISKNYYKTYGLLSIDDDQFLSFLGAAMGIIGGVSLFIWGVVLDKINVKTSLVILYVSFVTFTLLMYFTPSINKWLYFVSVNMLAATYNCKYPTYVTVCITYFGSKHFSSNFGMLSASRILVGFAVPPILDSLLSHFNWFSIFGWTASLTTFDLILILLFVPRGKAPK